MFQKLSKIFFAFALVFTFSLAAQAQMPDASTPSGRTDPTRQVDLPEAMRENLAKQRIKSEEKQFQELVARGEEAARLGEELDRSLAVSQTFSREDVKKLERLEKLVKKIRDDLGAEDEGSDKNKVSAAPEPERNRSLNEIIKNIKVDTANLLSEIKRIGRHSISVVAIESSNALLKMVRFLRFLKN